MRALAAWLAGLALLLAASPASAQEVIRNFHATYDIEKDGSVLVTETIRVRSEQRAIRRGIFRTIPTRYRGTGGERVNVGFTFIDATRAGQPEQARVSRQANGVNIRLGREQIFLPRGEHRYRIRYRIERGVLRFDDFDELYASVTGNDWDFPIERAGATINLPADGPFLAASTYTGAFGVTRSAARVVHQDARQIRFETTRALGPREGLTVAASFPKGVVAPLSAADKLERKLADMAPPIGGLLGFLLIAGYYLYAWRRVGRDPPSGTVVPAFAPPDDMSPAAIRYLTLQRMDNRGFSAALVDSAIKGHVRLHQDDGGLLSKKKTRIERLTQTDTTRPLGEGERDMLQALALPGETIEMDNEHHAKFARARKELAKPYERDHEGVSFHRNLGWAFAGLLVFVAGLWIAATAVVWAERMAAPDRMLLSLAGVVAGALFFVGRPDQGDAMRWPVIILAILSGGAGLIAGAAFIPLAFASGNILPLLFPLVGGGAIAISGFFWMDAPTRHGRALLDRIAGFKQYLGTTAQERYDRMQPADQQLKLFERYLPYAIALGVENKWAGRFENALENAIADPGSRGAGSFWWYAGNDNAWSNPTRFASSLGAGMASTISSASSAPSSSGSGGGGFSGGGIGGGGGGGW